MASCSITKSSVTNGIRKDILKNSIGKGFTYGNTNDTLRVTNLKKAVQTSALINQSLGGEVLTPSYTFPNEIYNITISDDLVKTHTEILTAKERENLNPRDVNYFNGDQALFEQEEKSYLQAGTVYPSRANDVTVSKLNEWLKGMGVVVEKFKPVMNGTVITGRALIEPSGALVQYTGDANLVLPEEAMHIAVEILEHTNPTLFNQMLNKIGRYSKYQEVLNTYGSLPQYQKDGKPDIRKLKKEAIAKVLVEQFILKEEGQVEAIENLQYSQTWWQSVMDFFRDIFFGENYNPFKVAAQGVTLLTAEDLKVASELSSGEEFFQLSSEQKANQERIATAIDQKLKDFQVEKVEGKSEFEDQDDTNFYRRLLKGKVGKVAKRVTDFVKDTKSAIDLARFENAPPAKKKEWKQKAEWGTKFHADAENIINAALDGEGRLKEHKDISYAGITSQMGNVAFNSLTAYLVGTPEVPGILYTQFPKGTLFRTEQMIYDNIDDVAGTIDLLGITPDGKVRIYDWKTKFLNLKYNKDVPFYSQKDYKIQLNKYRSMLDHAYGIKKSDVEVAQAMPIILSGTTNNVGDISNITMTLPAIDYKEENRRYLLPVPIESQSTGNPLLDKYVEALTDLHKILYNQKTLNKELKNEQLNAISGAIRELQLRQNFGPLAEQGEIFLKGAERTIEEVKNTYKGPDGKFKAFDQFSKAQLDEMLEDFKVQVENIDKYTSLYKLFVNLYKTKDLSKEEEKIKDNLGKLSLHSGVVKEELEAASMEFTAWVAENTTEVKDILTQERPVTGFHNTMLSEISKIQTKGVQVLRALTSRAKNNARINFNEESKKLEKILDTFREYAKGTGLGVRDYFSLITEKNSKGQPTNKLVRQYKKEFTTKYEEAVLEGKADVEWLADNIDTDKFIEYAKERMVTIAADISKSIYPHRTLEELQKIREDKAKEAFAKFDISTPESQGWYHPALQNFPKEKWTNPEYIRIQNTPALKEMYNFIFNLNDHAKKVGYHDRNYQFTKEFLPWLKSSMADNIRTSGISSIYDSLIDYFKLTPEEQVSYVRVDPNTGEIERSIPAYFTRGDFAKNEEGDYDLSRVSTDLGKTITLYMAAVYEYESLANIETLAKSVLEVEKTKGALQVDEKGNIIMKPGTSDPEIKENKENVKILVDFMDTLLYKKEDIGIAGLTPEQTKALDKANKYVRTKVFSLNIVTPLTILFGGNFQALINANKLWRGREWIANEGKIIMSEFKGMEGNLEKGLIDYFLPLTSNTTWETARRMSLDRLQSWSFVDKLMSPLRKTDEVVQMTTALTMLKNSVLIDGKIVNARQYILDSVEYRNRYYLPTAEMKAMEADFENKVQELLEKDGLMKKIKFNSENVLEIEGIDRLSTTVYNTRLSILNEIKSITGAMSEEDKKNGDRNVLLRSVTMFKNWIVPMVSTRIQELKFNTDVSKYEMGRARIFFQLMKHGDGNFIKGIPQGIKNIIDMQAGNERGVKLLQEYFEKTKATYKKKTNKELEMTPEQFFDMTRQAIAQQAKETALLLTLLSGFLGVWALQPDDDDDKETKNKYLIASRIYDKLVDELSFYYNPLSLYQISQGSWLPSIGILNDGARLVTSSMQEVVGRMFGVEDWEKNAHPTKNFLKVIPVANKFADTFLPMWNAEMAKELGYRVSKESRR